jgi:hypothetical protein
VVVANFFDSPVNDLMTFGSNRFDQLSPSWPRAGINQHAWAAVVAVPLRLSPLAGLQRRL